MRTLVVQSLCAVAVAFVAASGWAKTTTLTIAASGQKWSEGTWDNGLPENGDIVVVSNGTTSAVTTINDLVTTLTRLDFIGCTVGDEVLTDASMTLEGNNLTLTGDSSKTTRYNGVYYPRALTFFEKVIFNVELTASSSSEWYGMKYAAKNTTFNKDVHIADDKTLVVYGAWTCSPVIFNGRVLGPNATFMPFVYHSSTYFRAPIDVAILDCRANINNCTLYFYAKGNRIGRLINTGATLEATGEGIFDPLVLFEQDGFCNSGYRFYGTTIGGVHSTSTKVYESKYPYLQISPNYGETLYTTFAPSVNCAVTNCYLGPVSDNSSYNKVIITIDSPNDSTQELWGGTNTMTGPLTVKRGTLRMTGPNIFKNLTLLSVEGGTFSTATTSTTTEFPALTTLWVGPSATFAVEDGCTATVFDSGKTDLVLAPDGTISVASGKSVSFKSVAFGGAQLTAGTYTKDDFDWITGDGALVVAAPAANTTYWKTAADGSWSDATKWSSAAAPLATDTAYVTAAGADYTVSIPSTATVPVALYARNDGTHATALDFPDSAAPSSFAMTLGYGGRIDIANGKTLALDKGSLSLEDGGRLKVEAGGTLNWTTSGSVTLREGARIDSAGNVNFSGATPISVGYVPKVSPTSCKTSVVAVTGGKFVNHGTITVGLNGLFQVSGDAVVTNAPGSGGMARVTDGLIDVSGNAAIDNGAVTSTVLLYPEYCRCGKVVFRENASWTAYVSGNKVDWGSSSSSDSSGTVSFLDHAKFDLKNCSQWRFTCGNVTMIYDSDATSSTGARLSMGWGSNSSSGTHRLFFKRGLVKFNNGIYLGGPESANYDSQGTILATVDGGALSMAGANSSRSFNVCSLAIGVGTGKDAHTNREPTTWGTLTLASGSITNRTGAIHVGCGRGVGKIIQTGGEFVNLEQDVKTGSYVRCPMTIGICNATGDYILSNGTHTAICDIYVGGADLTKVGGNYESWMGAGYANSHDATGTLAVAAMDLTKPCSFKTTRDLFFGQDGNGILELGEGGTISASNVTFYAGAVGVTNHSSIVNFTLGATGAGKLTASGTVTIQSGTKLTVDASRFTGRGRLRLIEAGAMSGTFAAGDITIVGGKPRDCIIQKPTGVFFSRPGGFALLVR